MKNKNIIFLSVSLVLIILLGIGVSYSIYNMVNTQDVSNTAYTKCFDVSITSQKNSIDLDNAYPISDEAGKKLTPFSFTITNTCDIFASYTVSLESLKDTTLNSKFLKVMLNNEELKLLSDYESTDTVNTGSIESHILAKGSLGSGDSEDYTLRLWIDYDTTLEDLDNEIKTFKSKIVVKAQPSTWDPVKEGYTTLHDAILANEYQTSPEASIKKIEAKGTPDLSNTAPIIKWVEKSSESISNVNSVKPALSAINSDDQTSNLTENDTLLKLYKTKTFDSETAYYTLADPVYIDPTTIDSRSDTEYYFINETVNYNSNAQKIIISSSSNSKTIYKVVGATKSDTKTTWNNVSYDSITYKLNVITLTGIESEIDKSDKGLYQETDDYGTTYYYRGNVKNNNVNFAGYYWQIVRINGDGSIGLMYNGTEKNATGLKQSISNNTYKFNSNYNKTAYVGYMYGDPSATTFEAAHSNNNDSDAKIALDKWYKTSIVDKGYNYYIDTNAGFCGDRSLYKGDGISNIEGSFFGAYGRSEKQTAQFTCPNIERDLYTTTDSNIGNKSLTYPVSLISYDEPAYAGLDYKHTNNLNWASSSEMYWLLTPSSFNSKDLRAIGFNYASGAINNGNAVFLVKMLRPVINLKVDVKITGGIGTVNEPFIVDTN